MLVVILPWTRAGAVITLMAIGNVMEDQTVDVMFSVEGTLEKNITVTVSIIGGGKYTLNFILVQLNIIMQSFSFVVIIQISWAAFCFACKLASGYISRI